MASPMRQPYTPPPRLVPSWAVNWTSEAHVKTIPISQTEPPIQIRLPPSEAEPVSTPRVDRPDQSPCPTANAPKAPASMSPALPWNLQNKRARHGRRRKIPHGSPPHLMASLMEYKVGTPTRTTSKPLTRSKTSPVAEKSDVENKAWAKLDECVTAAGLTALEEDSRDQADAAFRWDHSTAKELIPRDCNPENNLNAWDGNNGACQSEWTAVIARKENWQQVLPSSPSSPTLVCNDWTEEKEGPLEELDGQYPIIRQFENDYAGLEPHRPNKGTKASSMDEINTFEYSLSQRQVDYQALLDESEIDHSAEVYSLSSKPEFRVFSFWRDDFAERYLRVLHREHRTANVILDQAFDHVRRQGFDMQHEGLEEVRKLVRVGNDFSERGNFKFNEYLAMRTRNIMMRNAGAWRRINLDDQESKKLWYSNVVEIDHIRH